MATARQDLEAQYAKALSIGATPQGFNLLKQAALGQNDDFDQIVANMALRKLTQEKTAYTGMEAQQKLAQGSSTVADKNVARADMATLPEHMGIGRLPAPNMGTLAAAEGGVMGYADGGVVGYADTGLVAPEGYEMFEDPVTGETYPRKVGAGIGPTLGRGYDAVAGFLDRATTPGYKKTPEWYAQNEPAPVAAPAAPAAAPAVNPAAKAVAAAPKAVKQATVGLVQPKAPVANPTEAQKDNMDAEIGRIDKLTSYLDKKYGDQFQPIKDQLEKDRAEYKNMKSENVGLALLGAAGAMLKPGRSTASAIGEGLGTLAEYGTKFQPQMLAARQGISAGEVGLAQAQAQAARGNFGTAAQLVSQDQTRALQERELAAKEPLYRAQASYYGAAAGAKSAGASGAGAELSNLKALQSNLQMQLKALQGKVDPNSVALAKQIQAQLQDVGAKMAARSGMQLNTGFVSNPGASGGNVFRSSLYGDEAP